MSNSFCLLLVLSISFLACRGWTGNADKQERGDTMVNQLDEIHIGMSLEDFQKYFPQAGLKPDIQWQRKETIHGLDGKWSYTFENGRLAWFLFDVYIDEIDRTHFQKCLRATEKIIRDYQKNYGKAEIIDEGDKTFHDPLVKRHWGYEVVKAVWRLQKEDFMVKFHFMGGKGEYYFVVKIEFQPPGYEYF